LAGGTNEKFSKLNEDDLSAESVRIVDTARNNGIHLRILGAMAVFIHTNHDQLALLRYKGLSRLGQGRPMFTDLDLMAYSNQRKEVSKFFEKGLGFRPDFYVNSLFGGRRNIYHHPAGDFDVDVFYDALSFSHEVKFGESPEKGRLQLDYPTISLADIALEKLQIHQINRKDLVDLFTLLSAHDISDGGGKETIDSGHIARVLSNDWGFEYDARTNLSKLKDFGTQLVGNGGISASEWEVVLGRVGRLIGFVEAQPKSKEWEKRAKKGTSKPWYNEVEEVER